MLHKVISLIGLGLGVGVYVCRPLILHEEEKKLFW